MRLRVAAAILLVLGASALRDEIDRLLVLEAPGILEDGGACDSHVIRWEDL